MSFKKRLHQHRHTLVLMAAIVVYAIVFSYATIQKHRDFHSYAWDLGVFNQVMYSSVYGGRLFHYTCDSYLNVKENYLAFHFSPILVLFFPIYYLFPYPSLLLVLKSTALAAAAYPLYRIGVKITDNRRTHRSHLVPPTAGAAGLQLVRLPAPSVRSSADIHELLPLPGGQVGWLLDLPIHVSDRGGAPFHGPSGHSWGALLGKQGRAQDPDRHEGP
jgi:hypothetical protein